MNLGQAAMAAATARDPRLDFFRGLAMFIIFVAHLPGNPWNGWIPARFGPSDATEMFVFCSGFASALAFGSSFRRHGFAVGALRIAYRCWQVYWSHLGLFVTVAALAVWGSAATGRDYVEALYLQRFFAEPRLGLSHLVALTYVPNYFDILPMYLVVLAMVPLVVALASVRPALALAFCGALWLAQWTLGLHLPAEWWSDRPWFFNPFGWQLLFFTGFAFASGWLPEPPRRRWLLALALAFVAAMVPLNWHPLWSSHPSLDAFSLRLVPFKDKSGFGPLRYLHFLALAYAALWLANGHRAALRGRLAGPVVLVGQQSLAVFLWSMALAFVGGMLLDQVGRDALTVTLANLSGFASLIAVAALASLVRTQPWRQRGDGGAAARVRHGHWPPADEPVAAAALAPTGLARSG
jgi:hypothetical protein